MDKIVCTFMFPVWLICLKAYGQYDYDPNHLVAFVVLMHYSMVPFTQSLNSQYSIIQFHFTWRDCESIRCHWAPAAGLLLAICSLHLSGLGLVSAGSRGRWKNESMGKSKWNGSVSNVHVTKLEGLHQIYIFSPEAIFLSLPEQFAQPANQLQSTNQSQTRVSSACACGGAVEDNKEVSTQERDINWHIASAAIVPKLH